jgi:3-hydroxyisobutyrate dehydrogenase-like beta-hydroxyacid dehydrogenase
MADLAPQIVGFVGLGDQGLPIAQAIADSDFSLHVWARHPQSLGGMSGSAFEAEPDIPALGAVSDVVSLCLSEDSDVAQIVTTGGLLDAMRPGSILVNHGTGLPTEARRIGELAESHGVGFVDAPVSGGHAVAIARQLTTIVGGSEEHAARLTPLFMTFSKSVIRVGPVGSGQFGKLFNNAVMMMNHKNVIDILALGDQLHLHIPALVEVLRSGSASSVALMAFGPSITSANAAHLQAVELVDLQLLTDALAPVETAAQDVVSRARAGVDGLVDLTTMIERSEP